MSIYLIMGKRKRISESKGKKAKLAKLEDDVQEEIPNELDEMKPLVEKVK